MINRLIIYDVIINQHTICDKSRESEKKMGIDIAVAKNFSLDLDPDEVLVTVDGDLSGVSGREIRRKLASVLKEDAASRVALDLGGVSGLDSSGLAALIGILRLVRERGGDVRVIAANAPVRRIFEITALARVFKYRPAQLANASAA